ncbi:MAG: hypothetical protein ACQEVA_07930 [Myxococcota bacterium]
MKLETILLTVCAIAFVMPTSFASAAEKAELDLTEFEWSASKSEVRDAFEDSVSTHRHRGYARLSTRVSLNDEGWTRYAVFHRDKLIAQGYERSERLPKPRFGSISDVVSYNNNYWVANMMKKAHGEPEFVDRRTKSEYSEELGDDALRMERAVEWDLLGERFRWELDDGTIRYSAKYSVDGHRDHNIVNVNPGSWNHYFQYRTVAAFDEAGVGRWRAFRGRAQRWVTKRSTANGDIETLLASSPESRPRQLKRTSYTSNSCRVSGESCRAHYSYYGGILYKIELDFSETKKLPRRAHFEDIGTEYYKHFKKIDRRLTRTFGSPIASKDAGDDLDNNRVQRRISNLTVGGEGFWSIWMDVGNDTLVRHSITGEQLGAEFKIDHKLQYYFHDVARVIADRDAWAAETKLISAD